MFFVESNFFIFSGKVIFKFSRITTIIMVFLLFSGKNIIGFLKNIYEGVFSLKKQNEKQTQRKFEFGSELASQTQTNNKNKKQQFERFEFGSDITPKTKKEKKNKKRNN